MSKSTLTIRNLALRVIHRNNYYTEDLLNLLPSKLLDTVFNNENTADLCNQLDQLRFNIESEFYPTLSEEESPQGILDSPPNSLPEKKEAEKRKIIFLFNLGMTLIHW